jgi:hypothetical protein
MRRLPWTQDLASVEQALGTMLFDQAVNAVQERRAESGPVLNRSRPKPTVSTGSQTSEASGRPASVILRGSEYSTKVHSSMRSRP